MSSYMQAIMPILTLDVGSEKWHIHILYTVLFKSLQLDYWRNSFYETHQESTTPKKELGKKCGASE